MACLPCMMLLGLDDAAAGQAQWNELEGIYARLMRIVNTLPAGDVVDSYKYALNDISVRLRQTSGQTSIGIKADWISSPNLWDREYLEMKQALIDIENSLAKQTAIPVLTNATPVQPQVTSVVTSEGEGRVYIQPQTYPNQGAVQVENSETNWPMIIGIGAVIAGLVIWGLKRK